MAPVGCGSSSAHASINPHLVVRLAATAVSGLLQCCCCCLFVLGYRRRYGQQLVPVEDDALLAYKPDPCMELLGFTAKENVPRW
jgi:hypothetical protein